MTAPPTPPPAPSPPTPAPVPPAVRRAAWRLARSREGSTAVEFGLLALPFLLLVTGIMDCSRIVWIHLALQAAVEQAARCAATDTTTCGTAAQVQAYAASLTPGVAAASFVAATPACGTQVSASLDYAVLVPGYLPATVRLTALSCLPL